MPNKITILRYNDNLNKYCIRKVGMTWYFPYTIVIINYNSYVTS